MPMLGRLWPITPKGTRRFDYDQLILATGAVPVRPPIRGVDDDAVHLLHTMDDALAVQAQLDDPGTRRAVIVGAGYIGLEMADALRHRDLSVTVVEALPEVMPTTDPQVGNLSTRSSSAMASRSSSVAPSRRSSAPRQA